ncbi:MAG TPA: DUF1501 domain-containing protein [Verrucomicrobiales bacterium]|nr:DUF1501 domain-containing protein [Verrucomicrobiales bacterium]
MFARTRHVSSPLAPLSRRRVLQSLSFGTLGLSLPEWLFLEARAKSTAVVSAEGQAKQVLVLYEEGGISQMDSFDPKPWALSDHRSPFGPIATSVVGTHFSSLMPLTAKQAHHLSVVRSMTSAATAGHRECCQEFFKGYRFNNPFDFPDIGSVVEELLGTDRPEMPGYIFCPGINMPNAVSSTGFLPRSRAPWKLGTKSLGENLAQPGWEVQSLKPRSGLGQERFKERHRLLQSLDDSAVGASEGAQAMKENTVHALDLLTSPAAQAAFDLTQESEATRNRYGRDHRGHCYLLGRRLIEAGVRFVTVTVIQPPEHVSRPGYGQPNGVFLNWDHHEGIYRNGPCGGPQGKGNQERYGLPHPVMMPSLDRSFSALIEDMHQRGLLDDTLVCFVTEMGRTPRINQYGGRDHWSRALSIAFAGAGCPAGAVIGATDKHGGEVTERLCTPYDYAATIYRKLGIPDSQRLEKPGGVTVNLTDGGTPIKELFG